MSETTLLYTLSTLAQTCAALAAFVGAVGLFRLQILREQRKEEDQTRRLYIYAEQQPDGRWKTPKGFGPFVGPAEWVEQEIQRLERLNPSHPVVPFQRRWEASARPIRASRIALLFFELWNVSLIAASLIGFNYINAWACARWTSYALWGVAVVTLCVTLYCVYVWTKRAEQ